MLDSGSRQSFAQNGDIAEKAHTDLDTVHEKTLTPPDKCAPIKGHRRDPRPGRAKSGTANDGVIEFRQDSRIWDLYLEGAEREARERAELWKTGLDSLLIFAGLFAGIVSSFVIDARKDVQLQSEQRFLEKISMILSKSGDQPSGRIPAAAQWTSALWILSLYVTLFGTIMGVLAKSWLIKFMPTTSSRREAKDACIRYELDKQAHRWYLKEIFTLVPLLVQLAAFLFLTGLVLQTCGDHLMTGYLLLASFISGGLIYLIITLLDLIGVSSPLNTPLSELFLRFRGLTEPSESDALLSHTSMDINMILADIIYTRLIRSPNPTHLDAAIAEIPTFKKHWIDFFCESKTPQIVFSRLRYSATARADALVRKDEVISNCMLALLQFVSNYEGWVTADSDEPRMRCKYAILNDSLHQSLETPNTLSRWNTLPGHLRPLLFILRTRAVMLLQNERLRPVRTPCLFDFQQDELSELPWEMALQEVPSSYRPQFVLAMCRGLVEGRPNIRIVSAFSLGVMLAKCSFDASTTGRSSDWTGIIGTTGRQDFTSLASTYLTVVYKEIAVHWESTVIEALSQEAAIFSKVRNDSALRWKTMATLPIAAAASDASSEHPPRLCLFRLLMALLSELGRVHRGICILAIRMLQHAQFPEDPVGLLQGIDFTSSILTIKRISLDSIPEVQYTGLRALLKFAGVNDEWKSHIQTVLVQGIRDEFQLVHKICAGETESDDTLLDEFRKVVNSLDIIYDLCFPEGAVCAPWQVGDVMLEVGREALQVFEGVKPLEGCIQELIVDVLRLAFVSPEPRNPEIASICASAQAVLEQMSDNRFRFSTHLKDSVRFYLESEHHEPPSLSLLESFERFINAKTKLQSSPDIFPWNVVDMSKINGLMSKRIVMAAVNGTARTRECACRILKSLVRDDRSRGPVDVNPEYWVDEVANNSSSRDNIITLLEGIIEDIHIHGFTMLASLVRLASRINQPPSSDANFRLDCLKLALRVCQNRDITEEGIRCVQKVLSQAADVIKGEPEPKLRALWIALLGATTRRFFYADAIEPILHFFKETRDPDTLDAVLLFFSPDDFVQSSEYYQSTEGLIETGIRDIGSGPLALLQGNAVRYARLLIRLLSHNSLPETLKRLCYEGLNTIFCVVEEVFNSPAAQGEGPRGRRPWLRQIPSYQQFQPTLRIMWAELAIAIATHETEHVPVCILSILQLVRRDTDTDVRLECLRLCTSLAGQEKAQEILLDSVDIAKDEVQKVRLAFARLLGVPGRHNNSDVSCRIIASLLCIGSTDDYPPVRLQAIDSLNVITSQAKGTDSHAQGLMCQPILDHIKQGLPVKDHCREVRESWIRLVSALISSAESEDILSTSIPQLVSLLARICIGDDDPSVRSQALNHLKDIYHNYSRLRKCTKQYLSEAIETSIHNADDSIRLKGMQAVDALTIPVSPMRSPDGEGGSCQMSDLYADIVAPCIPHILKMNYASVEEDTRVRDAVMKVMLQNLTKFPRGSKFVRFVFTSIPPLVVSDALAVQSIAERMMEILRPSRSIAVLLASDLASIFSNASQRSTSRKIAIKLFSSLIAQYQSGPLKTTDEFDYAIPVVTSLALDERHGEGELRLAAVELLSSLSTTAFTEYDQRMTQASRHLSHLTEKIMGLLEDENLRPSVVNLLSAWSSYEPVRKKINAAIVTAGLAKEGLSLSLGHAELLLRMVLDGRFKFDEPTDYTTMLYLSTVLDKPQLSYYQLKFYTALWSRYGSGFVVNGVFGGRPPRYTVPYLGWEDFDGPSLDRLPDAKTILIDWFRHTLFGRHTTVAEVANWLQQCKRWLPAENTRTLVRTA